MIGAIHISSQGETYENDDIIIGVTFKDGSSMETGFGLDPALDVRDALEGAEDAFDFVVRLVDLLRDEDDPPIAQSAPTDKEIADAVRLLRDALGGNGADSQPS